LLSQMDRGLVRCRRHGKSARKRKPVLPLYGCIQRELALGVW
jgi:hypothetical protein